ncbi:hypothetical protein QJS66_02210 [Kocuria rhizophila]|nr:hypothetical protein QJS66_02210 [Kocuria rhizophila]
MPRGRGHPEPELRSWFTGKAVHAVNFFELDRPGGARAPCGARLPQHRGGRGPRGGAAHREAVEHWKAKDWPTPAPRWTPSRGGRHGRAAQHHVAGPRSGEALRQPAIPPRHRPSSARSPCGSRNAWLTRTVRRDQCSATRSRTPGTRQLPDDTMT